MLKVTVTSKLRITDPFVREIYALPRDSHIIMHKTSRCHDMKMDLITPWLYQTKSDICLFKKQNTIIFAAKISVIICAERTGFVTAFNILSRKFKTWFEIWVYWTNAVHNIYVGVNFDALATRKWQDVFLRWMQDSNPGSLDPNHRQTECQLTNWLSYRGSG